MNFLLKLITHPLQGNILYAAYDIVSASRGHIVLLWHATTAGQECIRALAFGAKGLQGGQPFKMDIR